MTYSFKKLWKILIDRNMTKQELSAKSGVSMSSLGKLKRGEVISIKRLDEICRVLNVEYDDILERIYDKDDNGKRQGG